MNELEQLASGEEVLKTMVSHIRELSEDEKIRQQCAARADYESRLVSQYNQGVRQGIEQTKKNAAEKFAAAFNITTEEAMAILNNEKS